MSHETVITATILSTLYEENTYPQANLWDKIKDKLKAKGFEIGPKEQSYFDSLMDSPLIVRIDKENIRLGTQGIKMVEAVWKKALIGDLIGEKPDKLSPIELAEVNKLE